MINKTIIECIYCKSSFSVYITNQDKYSCFYECDECGIEFEVLE